MSILLVALGQMSAEYGNPNRNIAKSLELIEESAQRSCDIVTLPECLDIGWTNPNAYKLAEPIPGRYSEKLCEAASASSIYVIAGITEKAGDRIYNSAICIDPDGDIISKYRKINILDIAQDIYSTGNRLSVIDTSLGKIGINICADNFPNSLVFGHSLARMGARIIFSPCAWAVKSDHDNKENPYGSMWIKSYRRLARLYGTTVAGVSGVGKITRGPWKGRKCIGNSLVIDSSGEVVARGSYGETAEELITASIEVDELGVKGTNIAKMVEEKGYQNPF